MQPCSCQLALPASEEGTPTDTPPPPTPTKGIMPTCGTHEGADLSVFDILNIFRRRWFLSRTNLIANTISAQKNEDGDISWVEFTPQYHIHLMKCTLALIPRPALNVKKATYVYVLELLNGKGNLAFFDVQKGGHQVNKAQTKDWYLTSTLTHAAKQEREQEVAKPANIPPCELQKYPNSKLECVKRAAASGQASQATPPSKPNKLATPSTSNSPTTPEKPPAIQGQPPTNSSASTLVTGDSWDLGPDGVMIQSTVSGIHRRVLTIEDLETHLASGLWNSLGSAPPRKGSY